MALTITTPTCDGIYIGDGDYIREIARGYMNDWVISSRVKLILYSIIGICIFVLAIATFIHFAFGGDKQETPPVNEDKTPPVHMEMKEQRTRSIHYAQKSKG